MKNIIALFVAVFGCAPEPAPVTVKLISNTTFAGDTAQSQETQNKYSTPTERRLYSNEIESSSFLWTNWNRFQENYHPNYMMDADPKTAWTDGAPSSGAGEWVRVKISKLEDASKIRLRMEPGYHKSAKLFKQNARPKTIEVVALPSKESKKFTLKDKMTWQEVSFSQKEGPLEAIEIRFVNVYGGSKYDDLCLSELEIYITALTKENAAFEKAKLDKLLAWKQERLDAAAEWSTKKEDAPISLAQGYILEEKELDGKSKDSVYDLLAAQIPEAKKYAERAKAAREAKSSWVSLSFSIPNSFKIPMVDGLSSTQYYSYNALTIPSYKGTVLLTNSLFATFDKKEKYKAPEFESGFGSCDKDVTFWRNTKLAQSGPGLQEVIMEVCHQGSGREATVFDYSLHILEFDDSGLLRLVDTGVLYWFDWRDQDGKPFLSGGFLQSTYRTTRWTERK